MINIIVENYVIMIVDLKVIAIMPGIDGSKLTITWIARQINPEGEQ